MPRRTRAQTEETHQRLMAAAIETFCDKGVARTTLDDVARRAGMTRGAVYWHFADKTALLRQILHQQPLPLECLNAQGDLHQDCARMTRAVLATTCTSPHRQIVTILTQRAEWDYAEDVVRRRILLARKRFMAFLEQMLCGAQSRGELPGLLGEDAVGRWVAAIQSAVSGVVFESLLLPARQRQLRIVQTLQLLLMPLTSGSPAMR
jgi:TetR/AcrR family acrAB operon transcriptional repressor